VYQEVRIRCISKSKQSVDSFKGIEKRLKALGAEFLRERLHTDAYFDDGKSSLRKSDSALRLRRQLIGRKEQIVITFKGPRRKGRFKQRQEIQFEVSDARLAEMFLAAIGYKKTLVFQKKREAWHYNDCEVALDELPLLGRFVEIEGPNERKIAAVQKKLDLADLPHIHESYSVLIQRKLRKLKRTKKEVFF
jgi:adenylate cyclase class 2